MAIKTDLVHFVRTLVRRDVEANDQFERKLDDDGWEGWPYFLGAVFYLAVRLRFQGGPNDAEIIRFVADLRAEAGGVDPPIDPTDAETLIKAVFDPSLQVDLSAEVIGNLETLIAYTILHQENLSDEELDQILQEARVIADRSQGNC
jgi:hypothetical protein